MATKLVIVESPAKAKTIAKFLGRGYKVEASQGHVRDLPKSQIGVSPENNFEPKYITIRGRGDILNRIRKEARSASKVYLATDPDREGEAISWHLANVLGIDEQSPCRIEFNEVTMKAVKAAVKNPRGIDIDRVNAQQARRVLDRLVGYKISPILWAKVKKGLSAGRVQSVAAKMICDRENEIDTFIPEEYYNVAGRFQVGGAELTARFYGENGEKMEIHTRADCDALLARAKEGGYCVCNIKKSERRKLPAAPFTTSNLQQEASRKLNFNTGKTMQIAQQLYEGVELEGEGSQGLVTYIRTDSAREEARKALSEYRENLEKEFQEHKALKQEAAQHQFKIESENAARQINKALSAEHLHIKREISKKQQELREKLFGEVREMLEAFTRTEAYVQWNADQIREALKIAGTDQVQIYLTPSDEPLLERLSKETGAALLISDTPFLGGIRAVIPGKNILIDNTLLTLFEAEKENFNFDGGLME